MLLLLQGPVPSESIFLQGQDSHRRKQGHPRKEWKCSVTSENSARALAGKPQELRVSVPSDSEAQERVGSIPANVVDQQGFWVL